MPRTLRHFALALLLSASPLFAATHTWTGANSSLWSDPGNWAEGVTPAGDANATLIFGGPGTVRSTSTDDLGIVTYASLISFPSGYTLDGTGGSSLALAGNLQLPSGLTPASISIPIAVYGGVNHNITPTGGTLTGGYGTLILSGGLSGSDPVSVYSSGNPFTVVLNGANSLTGTVGLAYATLEVDGSLAGSVNDTYHARLRGTGTIGGDVSVAGGSYLQAGTEAATGILSIKGNLSFTYGVFSVRLNGPAPGTGYDQVQVAGNTYIQPLAGAVIAVSAGFVPAVGSVFTVIEGTGPLSGSGFPTDPVYTSNCLVLQPSQTATSVLLTVEAGGPPLGNVTISSSGGQTTYCNGTGGTATVTDAGGCANTHQWGYRTVSGGAITNIAGATGSTYLINGADFPGPGTYYLVETTTPTDNTPMTSNEQTITVVGPTAGTASGTTTICAGQLTQLHATGGTGCSWSPIVGLSDPNSCNPVASPAATTTYVVTFSGTCAAPNQPSVTVTVLPSPSMRFYTITPCRAVTTISAPAPLGGPVFQPSEIRNLPLTTACGVSATAKALAANVTVVQPGASGDLRIYPANLVQPLASALNFKALEIRANNVLILTPCDGSGQVSVYNESAGPMDLLIDVFGYFE